MRDSPANTKDLLDSRSVVHYSFHPHAISGAEVPLSLPVPITQHAPGPAFVQCLVIHTEAMGEREWVKEKNRSQAPWSASDPSRCTVLDGCPTLGQDEDPGTPGLRPRQPHQATQHHDATNYRPADEETQGHLGVRH
jgi:hypothetical protein